MRKMRLELKNEKLKQIPTDPVAEAPTERGLPDKNNDAFLLDNGLQYAENFTSRKPREKEEFASLLTISEVNEVAVLPFNADSAFNSIRKSLYESFSDHDEANRNIPAPN